MKLAKLFRVCTEDVILRDNQDTIGFFQYEAEPKLLVKYSDEAVYLKEKHEQVRVTHIKVNGESYYGVISPELKPFVDALVSEKVSHLVLAHRAEKALSEGNLSVLKARITLFNTLPWYKRIFRKIKP